MHPLPAEDVEAILRSRLSQAFTAPRLGPRLVHPTLGRRLSGQSRRSKDYPGAERQTSQAGHSGGPCDTACPKRNYRTIVSWSAGAKIRTKVIVCIQESENQGGVSL
jgi:hypothetical protein